MDQPTAEEILGRLEPLVGTWEIEAGPPGEDPWPGGGKATFEWHESRAHLIQRTTIALPQAPDTISLIGCDGANDTFTQLYTDDRGVSRIYAMTIDAGRWTLHREGEPFDQRFTATISEDGATITGRWEKREHGGDWEVDFDLTYRRVG